MLDKQINHPTVVWKTGKKNKSPSTLRRDKNRLLKWLELKKMNTDTDSISSYIPTYNADDVNITPRAQQNMNTTVSELTVLAEDNSGIPYNSSIIVSLPTVSSCFNETSISNTCNKPTTIKSLFFGPWQPVSKRDEKFSEGGSFCVVRTPTKGNQPQ